MRQFILENQKIKNGIVTLESKDFRYLRQVLRVKVGDMVNLRLPNGNLQNSTVVQIDDKSKIIKLQFCGENLFASANEKSITRGVQSDELEGKLPEIEYWLFQFLPKAQKFEQIVRQATECGITNIVPIVGEYTEKSSLFALEGNKKERLEKIVKEARQQSGSPVNTRIHSALNLNAAVELWNSESESEEKIAFVLSERDDCPENLRNLLSQKSQIKKVAIAVGSEGGISSDEVRLLEEKGLFHPIHFAVNILRCETAALYGIAAVQSAIN